MNETQRLPQSLSRLTILACHRKPYKTRINILPLLLFFALSLCGARSIVHAQAAYFPGGLLVHPTAFTPPRNATSIYMAGFTQKVDGMSMSFYPLSLSYSPTDQLQVSAITAYHQDADTPTHTHIGGFVKYQLLPDTKVHPAVAVTAAYVAHDHFESTLTGVASHALTHRGRVVTTLHLGAKWLRTPHDFGGQSDIGGFIGAEVPLSRQWTLVGETSTRFRFEPSAASSIGVMYHSKRAPDITIGFVNGGRSDSLRFFFGVGYPFGG